MAPETRFRIEDMLEYARAAVSFLGDSDVEALLNDQKLEFAVIRAVQIVGEAAAKVPEDVRASSPSIFWKKAIAMRHILVHAYRRIELRVVVDTIREDFPPLILALERLLAEGEQE